MCSNIEQEIKSKSKFCTVRTIWMLMRVSQKFPDLYLPLRKWNCCCGIWWMEPVLQWEVNLSLKYEIFVKFRNNVGNSLIIMVQIAATKLFSFWIPCLPQSERFSVKHDRRSQIVVAKKHESECRENSSPMALLWEWDYQDFGATLKTFAFQSHLLLDGGIFDSKLTEILLSVATLIFEFQVWDKSIKCVFFWFLDYRFS